MENVKTNVGNAGTFSEKEYELIHLEKTKVVCGLCESFSTAKAEQKNLIAVMSCEGACLRGEVSRRVANELCFKDYPEETARVCLGGAFTKDTGQRNMVRKAERVISLEGYAIQCASRMMKGVINDLKPEIILVDKYYIFDKNLFAINEVTEEELEKYSAEAAGKIKTELKIK
jgi:uncharacterized metal-binding protein